MLFEDAVSAYWSDKSRRLRGNTLEGYASAIRRHLMPAWGGREVESITHDELQAWVDGFEMAGAAFARECPVDGPGRPASLGERPDGAVHP